MLAITLTLVLAWIGGLTVIALFGILIWGVGRYYNSTAPFTDYQQIAIDMIEQERRRQILEEGYLPTRDDNYKKDELAIAASCYLYAPLYPFNVASGQKPPNQWPLAPSAWKPVTGRIRQLVKAGGLVIADLERELRKEEKYQRAKQGSRPAIVKPLNHDTKHNNT